MQITINDEAVDYTLENETNLYEVLQSVRSLVEAEGYILTTARTESRELDLLADEELKNTPISAVESLHLQAQSPLEKEYRDLAALSEFFGVLRNAIVAENADAAKRVLEDYSYVKGGIDGVLDRYGAASAELGSIALDRLVVASGLLETGEMAAEEREQLLHYIDTLRAKFALRMHEMEEPQQELLTAADALRTSIEKLNEVSVMLQTGRDAEAMQTIVEFVELSSKIVRLYPGLKAAGGVDFTRIVVDDISFPDFYSEFNSILSELIEAFTAEDSVLIGDLLEYEISPRLEKLRAYIDLLTTKQ